jgi:glycosyltransferase involved in cell wall biosynthesis
MGPLLGPDRQLLIVGEGADRPRIEAAAQALGPAAAYVHLLGLRRDVPQILPALDVFALTSYTEGLPLVIPEAMACGLPVVATAVGGVPGIVPEPVGVLRDHGDEEGLRGAFAAFAADTGRRARMAAAARAHAHAHFSLETMAARYAALYQLREGRGAVARRLIGGLPGLWGPP